MKVAAVLPLTAAQESSLLARYRATAPANFHHATTSLTLAASRRRWALLFISATVVLVQLTVAISVANGVDAGACVESWDCRACVATIALLAPPNASNASHLATAEQTGLQNSGPSRPGTVNLQILRRTAPLVLQPRRPAATRTTTPPI